MKKPRKTRTSGHRGVCEVQVEHQHIELAFGELDPDMKMLDDWPSKLARIEARKALEMEKTAELKGSVGKNGKKRKSRV